MRIAMIVTRVRREEKLLMQAFEDRGIALDIINDNKLILRPLEPDFHWFEYDLVLQRSLSGSRALATLQILESWGVRTLNTYQTAAVCADKLRTTLALAQAGLPQASVSIAFSEKSILQAIEDEGYPVVLKPLVGSWGRLVTKINDPESAEAILEHRFTLGNYPYHTGYVQEFLEKPFGRDIRVTVIGDRTVCAIFRHSKHWITNTARGGIVTNCAITNELDSISRRTADAIGGGALAIDIFETDDGLLVNEVNHVMEFRNSIEPTGVDIPGAFAEYAIQLAQEHAELQQVAV